MSTPTRSHRAPTDVELGLIRSAGYETQLRINAANAKRGMHTMSALIAIAAVVFSYDVLSLLIPHWALAIHV